MFCVLFCFLQGITLADFCFFQPQFGSYLGDREGPVLVSFLDNRPENLEVKPKNKLSFTSFYASALLIAVFVLRLSICLSHSCDRDV